MAKVTLIQPPFQKYIRLLTQADLDRLGVAHKGDVRFSAKNKFTVEMSDDACDTLVQKLPREFKVVTPPTVVEAAEPEPVGADPEPSADSAVDESGQAEPQGSSSESEEDQPSAGESTPSKRRRNP